MPSQKIENIRISQFTELISPNQIREELPLSERANETIGKGRYEFRNIINNEDDRLVVIVGPCSIHDEKSAIEYAEKLSELKKELDDKLMIIMRVYFEKPRTTVGWKGLINDPHLDESHDMEEGLRMARKILIKINEMGLYTATEVLDPVVAAYTAELVSWIAVGARTTESQTHRQMTSGLSAPIGFKNGSSGNLDIAINAMQSAKSPHHFLGINDDGKVCIIKTIGNQHSHLILRGGREGPNYNKDFINQAEEKLNAASLEPKIMVDCSHQNSGKDHTKQKEVLKNIIEQKQNGNQSIFGIMLESHLKEGNQKMKGDLEYGVSITDACIGWEETEELMRELHQSV